MLVRTIAATLLVLATPAFAHPPEKKPMSAEAQLDQLAFLAGTWRNEWYEATYTTPAGGMVLSVNKEFRNGKVTFFELERFDVQNGRVVMQPYLNGKQSPVSFPLHVLEPGRAHFSNPAHDFPQDLVYERVGGNKLQIRLTGVENGKTRELLILLTRV